MSEQALSQIRRIAPFLDTHVLMNFLKNYVPGTDKLVNQIQDQTLINQKEKAQQQEEEAKNEAGKLLTLLNNHQEYQKLRAERGFTLEKLNEDRGITLQDCKKVFSYAKIQYELGKYKEAEKLLFSLKEILISEQYTQTEFILQVFWGLLSCEILLQREKETVEFTTLRKMKEFIEKLLQEQSHNYQESMSHKAWLLHQILVYSFTNDVKKQPVPEQQTTDLFAEILIDRVVYGQVFLNIIQIKCQYLLRYLIASLLLCKNFDSIVEVALPIVLQEKNKYSDAFTQYVETLYENFDFGASLALAKEIGKIAQEDILLKPYAAEIQTQAALLVYQIKSQIYKGIDIKQNLYLFYVYRNISDDTGISAEDSRQKLEENMKMEGFQIEIDPKNQVLSIIGQLMDTKGRIVTKISEIVKRTNDLNKHYQQQMQFLNDHGFQNLQGK